MNGWISFNSMGQKEEWGDKCCSYCDGALKANAINDDVRAVSKDSLQRLNSVAG